MIKSFVDRWDADKELLREVFAAGHPNQYFDIVKAVVMFLEGVEEGDEETWDNHVDPTRITEIDYGEYHGTLLYVIGGSSYQTSRFWYVKVSYGSCSGCDTLKALRDYASFDDKPTDNQIEGYMTLALHIIQGLKRISPDDTE